MDLTDSLGNGMGGGEILKYWDRSGYVDDSPFLNNPLIQQYNLIPLVIVLIIGIILFIMIRILMNMYNVKSIRKGKGIISELEHMDKIKQRDASILRYNKFIQRLTKIVESTVFKSNRVNKEYIEYNIERACVKIPGGSRYMRAEEWNACIVGITSAVVVVGVLVSLFAHYAVGAVMIIATLLMAGILPMAYLRSVVKVKDDEIRENFSDFYLMIHYVLMAGAKTPLNGIMKSYAKTTDSKEMKRMVDVCIHYMDTYGEYEGARYISRAYREIPVMGKLMRLIRQSNEGGDISAELMGFRAEVLNEKRYAIELRTDKLIKKARASFYLLMPVLFQAILSAMSIYLSDMGMITTFVP